MRRCLSYVLGGMPVYEQVPAELADSVAIGLVEWKFRGAILMHTGSLRGAYE